jgi:hypothetical protein
MLEKLIKEKLLTEQFQSFDEFFMFLSKFHSIKTCQKNAFGKEIFVKCLDCGIEPNSGYCLECFLNSDHENHNLIVDPSTLWNCDCGDSHYLKPETFCSKHSCHQSPPLLDEETSFSIYDFVISTFKCFGQIGFTSVFQVFSKLISVSDQIRDIIVSGTSQYISSLILLIHLHKNPSFTECLMNFFGQLINNPKFIIFFTESFYETWERTFSAFESLISKTNIFQCYFKFLFHIFSPYPFYETYRKNPNIPIIYAKLLNKLHSLAFKYLEPPTSLSSSVFSSIIHFSDILKIFSFPQKFLFPEVLQYFFEDFFQKELEFECQHLRDPLTFTIDDPQILSFLFVSNFSCSQSQQSFFIQCNLTNIIQIISILTNKINKNIISFSEGSPISFQLLIHSYLPYLLLPNQSKMKSILHENFSNVDEFLISLLIFSIKPELASILHQTHSFPTQNPFLLQELFNFYVLQNSLSFRYSLFLLIQLIFGLAQNKTLLFDLIFQLIGISQDDSTTKLNRLLILLFITRIATYRSFLLTDTEQILSDCVVSLIIRKPLSPEELFQNFPYDYISKPISSKVISSVANLNDSETFFHSTNLFNQIYFFLFLIHQLYYFYFKSIQNHR